MLLLSIHPVYVEKIFAGMKTVELRKRKPNVEVGSKVVIYSTMPECEIVGFATISGFEVCSPNQLWNKVNSSCGVTKAEFNSYFSNSEISVGIHLTEPVRFEDAFSLSNLRKLWPGFHPPQQFQYLKESRLDTLFGSLGCASV